MSDKFNRNNIDYFLYQIAREYKKQNRVNPDAEIILVGGAAVLMNYNIRETTTDIDALMRASSSMKDVIRKVGEENGLENGWLNDDFKKTKSYSPKLVQYSKFYKKFCNCLSVRIVTDEYLVAMKLCASRNYKHDISDIVGIIKEHNEKEKPLTLEKVYAAYKDLYGERAEISEEIQDKLKYIIECKDLEQIYYQIVEEESENKTALLETEKKYANVITDKNAADFIRSFRNKGR